MPITKSIVPPYFDAGKNTTLAYGKKAAEKNSWLIIRDAKVKRSKEHIVNLSEAFETKHLNARVVEEEEKKEACERENVNKIGQARLFQSANIRRIRERKAFRKARAGRECNKCVLDSEIISCILSFSTGVRSFGSVSFSASLLSVSPPLSDPCGDFIPFLFSTFLILL